MYNFECPECGQYHNVRESSLRTVYRCRGCRASIRFEERQGPRPPFPVALHVILCVFSCGLWLPLAALFYALHESKPRPTVYRVRVCR